jgi:hypothetical protein
VLAHFHDAFAHGRHVSEVAAGDFFETPAKAKCCLPVAQAIDPSLEFVCELHFNHRRNVSTQIQKAIPVFAFSLPPKHLAFHGLGPAAGRPTPWEAQWARPQKAFGVLEITEPTAAVLTAATADALGRQASPCDPAGAFSLFHPVGPKLAWLIPNGRPARLARSSAEARA